MQNLIKDQTIEDFDELLDSPDFWEEDESLKDLEEFEEFTEFKPLTPDLLSFEDVKQDWGLEGYARGSAYRCLTTTKSVWDNFRNPPGMGSKDSIIYKLERVFPGVESARRRRPLGEFKELLSMDHKKIYDTLAMRFIMPHTNRDGKQQSFMQAAWLHADELFYNYLPQRDRLTEQEFYRGMSLMLYQSCLGIYLEGETDRHLSKIFANSKLGKRFRYAEASWKLESKDVDAVIIDRKTGEVVVNISIKCLGALTQRTVDTYRLKKGKTVPDIYLGFKSLRAAEEGELSAIKLDGKGLNSLLREAIA